MAFRVYLDDVGDRKVTRNFKVGFSTLVWAERIATLKCFKITGCADIELRHDEDLVYDVLANGVVVGRIKIRSL